MGFRLEGRSRGGEAPGARWAMFDDIFVKGGHLPFLALGPPG